MGMTVAEKILAAHTGKKKVSPGDLVQAKVDLVMMNDITGAISVREFRKGSQNHARLCVDVSIVTRIRRFLEN